MEEHQVFSVSKKYAFIWWIQRKYVSLHRNQTNHQYKTEMMRYLKGLLAVCLMMGFTPLYSQQTYDLPTKDRNGNGGTIEVYLPQPDRANGSAVVLCAGGAMRFLSWDSDVKQMAAFLNEKGYAAIGLRYHLYGQTTGAPRGMQMPPTVDVTHFDRFPHADANPLHYPAGDSILQLAAADGRAAIRFVRQHADEWHLNANKIGYLGFSAGGGVAIAATTQATNREERPDFLCTNFGPALSEVKVPENAPPLLIMTRVDHPNVAAGLLALFLEWKRAGANAELHMYGDGRGPYALMEATGKTTTEAWSQQLLGWLEAKGFGNGSAK